MKTRTKQTDELRPEYEFDYSKAVRGKYCRSLLKGSNVVVLEEDIARSFRDSASVNTALRSLLQVADTTKRLTRPVKRIKSNRSSL